MEWFLIRRFVGLLRTYFLLIIGRNHSNTVKYYSKGYLFWYQNFDGITENRDRGPRDPSETLAEP